MAGKGAETEIRATPVGMQRPVAWGRAGHGAYPLGVSGPPRLPAHAGDRALLRGPALPNSIIKIHQVRLAKELTSLSSMLPEESTRRICKEEFDLFFRGWHRHGSGIWRSSVVIRLGIIHGSDSGFERTVGRLDEQPSFVEVAVGNDPGEELPRSTLDRRLFKVCRGVHGRGLIVLSRP